MYLLGIDAGTSVVKAALFDRDGQELGAARRPSPLITPRSGWVEADMHETWRITCAAISDLLAQMQIDPAHIAAVGVTGQMVGAWLIDEQGQPLRNAMLHVDNRAQPLMAELGEQHPGFMSHVFDFSGAAMQPGCTLPLVAWMDQNEPELLDRAAHVLCCKDWLIYQLTGSIQIDTSEVTVLPGDTRARDYAEPLFDLMGIRSRRHLFPPVAASDDIVGVISPEAAQQTGLAAGTPVVAGAGDVLASTIGVGAVTPGTACTLLGTACHNGLVTAEPAFEPRDVGLMFSHPGGYWVRMMLNVLGTPNLDWAIAQFFSDLPADDLFVQLEARAEASGIGANGLIFLPYLSPTGLFTPFVEPRARAEFFGLTIDHTRDDMLRAVYEGVAYCIRDSYDTIPAPIEEIRLSGGGANSAFWSQMIADITGRRILVPHGSEFGARGAAILAGRGLGWYEALSDVPVAIDRSYEPQQTQRYEPSFRRYQALAQALRPVWNMP